MDIEQKIREIKTVYAFGAVLMDVFPDGPVIGGAPFNFAYYTHLSKIPTEFISTVGTDKEGSEILKFLAETGMSSRWVAKTSEHPTGVVKITLDSNGVPTFTLRNHAAYDYISKVPDKVPGALIYFGSGEQRAPVSRNALLSFIDSNRTHALTFCDLNLRPPYIDKTMMQNSLERTDILKINEEELAEISQCFSLNGNAEDFFRRFDLSLVLLTKGAQGATAYLKGQNPISLQAPKVERIIDTVGAGDAFSGKFVASFIQSGDLTESLGRAVAFASETCRYRGALLPKDKIASLCSQ